MVLRFTRGSDHITGSLILTSLSQLTDVTFADGLDIFCGVGAKARLLWRTADLGCWYTYNTCGCFSA